MGELLEANQVRLAPTGRMQMTDDLVLIIGSLEDFQVHDIKGSPIASSNSKHVRLDAFGYICI
jgi:hypothetical protein